MSYVASVLQPGERIVRLGRLHWIVYRYAILFAVLAIVCAPWAATDGLGVVPLFCVMAFGVLAVLSFAVAWFERWITEIAVTDRRIIYKRGFINRHTVEMNMDKVAAVDVNQSILGRLLGYGSVCIVGLGATQATAGAGQTPGIKDLGLVAEPLALRSAITAK
ncbi:PH domain-containing protein [Rhodoplanes sp. Z2-YC6860]|uniref:PH domain-containing protein n=1 Tax=Rhodoplanes sp. Z2-YC6860 TaxID=674703 RepID=UPI00078C53A6|nr:PH domain-containing protein [Rhodoplanes sp. Z2-YC6860]AMN39689.1 membrane-flanked domain-containing protein [Rhodoplanes sp. Z2-YC6860]